MLAYHPLTPLVLSRNVDLLPHQPTSLYDEHNQAHRCPSPIPHKVVGLLRVGFSINALIADETGLGKTVITFSILSLMLRGITRNIVIVAPKVAVGQYYYIKDILHNVIAIKKVLKIHVILHHSI